MPPSVSSSGKENAIQTQNKFQALEQDIEDKKSMVESTSQKKRLRRKNSKKKKLESSRKEADENNGLLKVDSLDDEIGDDISQSEQEDRCLIELQALEELSEDEDVVLLEQDNHSDDLANLLIKPYVQMQSAKQKKHEEDRIISGVHCVWQNIQKDVKVPFSIFGICDGHGGGQASSIATKRLVYYVKQYLFRLPISDVLDSPDNTDSDNNQDEDELEKDEVYEQLLDDDELVNESVKMQWKIEDEMVRVLPQILHTAFIKVDKECKEKCEKSGTTATLLVMVGWQLVVASVGDSYCYVDNGKAVKLVSSNHRVEDNQEERQAVLERGGEIAKEADEDNKPVGPLRVWPGGIQMSRSLGDLQSAAVISPLPDIKVVTIPPCGSRIVVASDGLWDAYKSNPKAAVHSIRGCAAGAAAPKLLVSAVKKVGLKDDISILVVDALREEKGVFAKGQSGPGEKENGFDIEVVDIPRNINNPRIHIREVRKQLMSEMKQKRELEAKRKADLEAERVKLLAESKEKSKQEKSYEDLRNLRIDVETLVEELNQPFADWQEIKKPRVAPKPPLAARGGRGSGRIFLGRGRGRGRSLNEDRNQRISSRVQQQQRIESERKSSSSSGATRAPIPSRTELSSDQVRKKVDDSVFDMSDAFAKFKGVTTVTEIEKTQVAEAVTAELASSRQELDTGRSKTSNTNISDNTNARNRGTTRDGRGTPRYRERSRRGNLGHGAQNNVQYNNHRPPIKNYVVKCQKPSEVVEFSKTPTDVISFQKHDVVQVQRSHEVVEVIKPAEVIEVVKANRSVDLSNNNGHSYTQNRGGRGSGLRGGRGGYGRSRGPRYTFDDIKTENKVSVL
eukprot:TRINITY_DN1661_c0_g1_i5.p1 TRINITY_DN1661_c0_g1~~TRINITY_DN1661_c0_g1_i5.p1  ORF type:complete len:848 (-),score=189.38 TRINITY_DN1661_c0_g1_i5:382-2925(-)